VHNEKIITEFPEDFYATDAFTEHAVAMVRRLAQSPRQPFFLNICYSAPHYPLQAPAADVARYRGKYAGGYDALRENRFRRQLELGLFDSGSARLASGVADNVYTQEVEPWDKLTPLAREREEARMEVYAAMVDRLDQGVGRLLAALDEAGVANNTAIFFLSDNGGCGHFPVRSAQLNPAMAQAPFNLFNRDIPVGDKRGYEFVGTGWGWAQNAPFRRFKDWTYEGGICTPMIVRWPGVVAAGSLSREPGHVVDFMPTLLEMAGARYPQTARGEPTPAMEGRSLVPILRSGIPAVRPLPLGWELYGSRAIRDGKWKLVQAAGINVWELYDLATDRAETIDLAGQHPERVAAMAAAWQEWAQRTEAPIR